MKSPTPHKRAGYWYLVRRVPAAYEHLDPRRPVRITTNIAIADDPKGIRAQRAVSRLNAELEAYWRGLLDGQSAEAKRRFAAARQRARSLGLDYVPAQELATRDLDEIVKRIELVLSRGAVEDEGEVAAVLGGEEKPALMLSGLVDEYEAIQRTSLRDMSADQMRKWRNPKKRAVENLLMVLGEDKPLTKITRNDALDFRVWWQGRIEDEDLEIETANKDIGHLNKMWRVVDITNRIGLNQVFVGLRIEGGEDGQRVAYDIDFVQDRILAEGVLDELNDEARRIVYVIADTGLRLSEACNLTAKTIHLDHAVPHVVVEPEGRRLKTKHSRREIPLVGAALAALRLHPDGFPRYRDRAATLSALVNKALSSRGLRPQEGQSLYSLRHTFEDRLTAIEAPEKMIAMLMGHKWIRPKYGAGPPLDQKRRWLSKIAFRPPVSV